MYKKPPIKYIAIHHTAVSRMNGKNQLLAVNLYHKQKWGMRSSIGWDVGYNRFIDVDGSRTTTRAIGEETVANVGHNCDIHNRCDTISVCVAGDFNQELLNDKEIVSLREEIKELKQEYPKAEIVFHKDLQKGRTCAGKLFTRTYLNVRILGEETKLDKTDTEKAEKIKELQLKVSLLEHLIALYKKIRYNR